MPTHPFLGFSEPFSSLSHFLGAGLCAVFSIPLWRSARGHFAHRLAIGIFCFASMLLLSMSGVYHLLPAGSAGKAVLQRLDHAAIFVLIAGTFTPLHAILFRGALRWIPLALIWTIAVAGIILKTAFFSQIPEFISIGTYLGMGWLGAFSGILIYWRWGFNVVLPLFEGAMVYTIGSIFEFLKQPVIISGVLGPHELFHVTVLFGIAYHWKFVHHIALSSDRTGGSHFLLSAPLSTGSKNSKR